MDEEKEDMELENFRLRSQEARVRSLDDLTKMVAEVRATADAMEQESLGKIYEKFLLEYLVDHDAEKLDSCPVSRSAAGIFARLPEPSIPAAQFVGGDKLAAGTAAKVTIVDSDGESFLVVDKAGLAARVLGSMAFRRACSPDRLSALLLREGTEVDPAHVLEELVSWSQACLHTATKVELWESTLAWASINKLRIFEKESFAAFLSFKPLPQSYEVYSLDHFVSGGVRGSDSLSLQTALRGLESVMEFTFGDAFHGVCEGTIRRLNRGELRGMDLGFVRYSLEMALRAWCKWMRSPNPIRPGVSACTPGRQGVCVAQLKKCLGDMPVESKDVEAFRASGFASLAKTSESGSTKRATESALGVEKRQKGSDTAATGRPVPAERLQTSKAICMYRLAFLVKRAGEGTRDCRFTTDCRAKHLDSLVGVSTGGLINSINTSALSVMAKKELIDRVKERSSPK